MVAIIRGGRRCESPRENLRENKPMNIGDIQAIPEPIVEINGIKISVELLAHAIWTMTNPDPKKWFRFSRTGDAITVETKYEP